jgi:transposase
VRRDFEALERRRLKVAQLLGKGLSQAEVARQVGVHRQSVSRWAKQLAEGGKASLRKAGRAGRKPRLSPADLRRVERGLKRGPEALGYVSGLWTLAPGSQGTARRVAKLIEQECGITYHPSHVWRILQALGWSAHGKTGRALEQDECGIWSWKEKRWPVRKKARRTEGEPLSSSTRVG